MKSSVIIKGNKYGFQIVLNPTLPFEELLREVGNKFKESTHFFDLNKPIAVSFTGRELTSGEQNLLVDTISENSGLNISCVIDGAKVYETQFAKVLNEIREEEKKEKKADDALMLIYQNLEDRMKTIMGTKVSIHNKDKNKGRIEIEYYSEAELERIVELIESIH